MRSTSIRASVLKVLRANKRSMTAFEVIDTLERLGIDATEETLSVTLSHLKRDKLIDNERMHCHCCGHTTGHYKLTDLGFIITREFEPPAISIAQFASLDEVA